MYANYFWDGSQRMDEHLDLIWDEEILPLMHIYLSKSRATAQFDRKKMECQAK